MCKKRINLWKSHFDYASKYFFYQPQNQISLPLCHNFIWLPNEKSTCAWIWYSNYQPRKRYSTLIENFLMVSQKIYPYIFIIYHSHKKRFLLLWIYLILYCITSENDQTHFSSVSDHFGTLRIRRLNCFPES